MLYKPSDRRKGGMGNRGGEVSLRYIKNAHSITYTLRGKNTQDVGGGVGGQADTSVFQGTSKHSHSQNHARRKMQRITQH